MAFPGLLVEFEKGVGSAQSVHEGPVIEVFHSVVGAVVAAPALDAAEEAAVIQILVGELAGGVSVGGEQGALGQGPGGRRHGLIEADGGGGGERRGEEESVSQKAQTGHGKVIVQEAGGAEYFWSNRLWVVGCGLWEGKARRRPVSGHPFRTGAGIVRCVSCLAWTPLRRTSG